MKFITTFILLVCCLQSVAQTSDSYGDNDGDGIRNSFDKCPKTLKGVDVDSHGCPKDTDGDGVADYLDKQLITPTECQPSDADGIGDCSCNSDCDNLNGIVCGPILANSIFIGYSHNYASVDKTQYSILEDLAKKMRSSPNNKIVIDGFVEDYHNKIQLQVSWLQVENVILEMSNRFGVDRDRFIFQYKNIGDAYLVRIRSAGNGDEGPSKTNPPYPELNRYIIN